MTDAGLLAVSLLKDRPAPRDRVLILIGQPMDSGSESGLPPLREQAERENVTVYTLNLPELGKAIVSDTFSLQGADPGAGGGWTASLDLGKLTPALNRGAKAASGADAFTVLTAATGGTGFHFRKQKEFENAIAALGVQMRSRYLLSYAVDPAETGYHAIRIEMKVAGAIAHTRAGYWLAASVP
jgi:hypothetical protein